MARSTNPQIQAAYIKNSSLPSENILTTLKDIDNGYFCKRMADLGIIDPKLYSFAVPKNGAQQDFYQPIFAPNNTDDIIINYPALRGDHEKYFDDDDEKNFYRLRFNPDKNRENKYYQPAHSGTHIFFPVSILDQYASGEKIDTLFLVEGEFKAQAGSMQGLDIIGLGGKDLFTDGEKELHPDIIAIITKCEVKNLVLLLDADVFALNWDKEEEPDKNLAKRISGFCNTVIKFRELTKSRVKDSYFSHVSERFIDDAKGLDDLFLLKKGNEKLIIDDLYKLKLSRAYFNTFNLSAETVPAIKKYFGLVLVKGVPAGFYARHGDIIKNSEFNFFGARYQFNENDGLKLVKDADSFKFIRVGCDYFKMITVPNTNKEGVLDIKRVPWKKSEITQDYVHEKGLKNFLSTVEKYDTFCNVPDNTGLYEPVIEGCYNLYSRVDHLPEEGKWPHIENYLKHVFGDKTLISGHTNYDLGLDYLQLLYLKPRQKLPILALVNKAKNTGKSTFLWLVKEMFQDNCTFIGNEELKDHLNDDWAGKLVVGIDEGFIDKKSVLERLKSMSTSPTIKLRGMYAGRQEIAFFGKFILTSNDEDNFAPVDKDEVRFWVNKVPVLTKDDPELVEKMALEIPAFLYFLQNRTLLHRKVSRHWFDPELLKNEALDNLRNASRSWLEMELREAIKDLFFEYQYHSLAFTSKELMEILNGGTASIKFRKADVVKQLKDRFNVVSKQGRYSFPELPSGNPDEHTMLGRIFKSKHGRCFEFKVEDFLSPEEMRTEFSQFYKQHEINKYREATAVPVEEDLPF